MKEYTIKVYFGNEKAELFTEPPHFTFTFDDEINAKLAFITAVGACPTFISEYDDAITFYDRYKLTKKLFNQKEIIDFDEDAQTPWTKVTFEEKDV